MPKQTFFNLPEDKRNTLICALEKEFSRVPLSKASISNIVKTAEIPRGSFYQYFNDKEDGFFFLLNERTKIRQENFVHILKENDGDLFVAMTETFQLMLRQMANERNLNFLKNTFLNMTHKVEHTIINIFSEKESSEQYQKISSLINKQNLNVSNDTELFHVMQILTAVISHNFVEKFAKELTNQEAIDNFTIEMGLLKRGFAIEVSK